MVEYHYALGSLEGSSDTCLEPRMEMTLKSETRTPIRKLPLGQLTQVGRLCAVFYHCFVFPLFCSVEIGFSIFPQCFQWFIFWFFDFLIISFLIFTLGFHCCLFWVCRLRQVSVDFKVLLFNISVWSYEIISKSCFGSAHQMLICLWLSFCLKQDRKIEVMRVWEGKGIFHSGVWLRPLPAEDQELQHN